LHQNQRATLQELIGGATTGGARQARACAVLGLSARTVQRWQGGGPEAVDGRALRHHDAVHELSTDERAELSAVANSVEFAHLPPSQIVPRLADQGRYIASESTFYRVLRGEKQLAHRHSERPGRARSKPRAVCADRPNQLFSWDITYLPTTVRGQSLYLYLFMDVFSHALRKSVKIFCSTSTFRYDDRPASAGGQRRCPQHEAVDSRLTAVPSLPTGSPRASPSA